MNKSIVYILFGLILFCSCNSYKEIIYLQDVDVNTSTKIQNYEEITLQPDDMLSITVSSENPELALPFNLTAVSYSFEGVLSSLSNKEPLYYTVNKNGNINMPILGEIHVEGFTKEQLANDIKEQLIKANYINNPTVTVQFVNMSIYITGEVVNAGEYKITKNRLTILEAIAMAGDLTVFGNRNNVKVIRERKGDRIIYSVNLKSAELFNSPAYYLQQNDYIYVEPVKVNRNKLVRPVKSK